MEEYQYFNTNLFSEKRVLEYVTDKSKSSYSIMNYMLARLQKMFKYKNLPTSIPKQYLENYLLINGKCVIGKDLMHPDDPNIYAFVGGQGGRPDVYYRPTMYVVANPALQASMYYYISDCDPEHEPNAVLVRNDTMWQGLYPMMARYASLISENLLTIRTADVMLRVLALITAPDDASRLAADQFLKDITDGHLASIAENRFLDGIRMQNPPSNNGSYLTQFIELHQYLVGSFYNEIGLNANYNMKREALSESETGLNDDSLMPLCEDMLRCRREDIAKVNSMFGTSIEVDFDSSWLENEIERLLNIKQQATESSSQLANPAPNGFGMDADGQEGASMEGAGMEEASGKDEKEDGKEESKKKDGKEDGKEKEEGMEDSGEDDAGSEDGESMESEDQSNGEESEKGIEEKIDDAVEKMIDIMIEDASMEDAGTEYSGTEDSEDEEGKEDSNESETEGLSTDT